MTRHDVIVIGASAGGVEALISLTSRLPVDLAATVLIVLHVSPQGSLLPRVLQRSSPMGVTHAVDGDPMRLGHIYVAPPDMHMALDKGRVRLAFGAKENGHRPSIDVLFRTAAWAYGPRVVGVVLTGRLDDGAAGLAEVKREGGIAVVQEPEGAAHPEMPEAALRRTTVDHRVSLERLGLLLVELAGQRPAPASGGPESVPPEPVEMDPAGGLRPAIGLSTITSNPQSGEPALLSCPQCNGTLWRSESSGAMGFRCRVGHAFSEDNLVNIQDDAVENSLWAAIRALEEQRDLLARLATRSRERGHASAARHFQHRSEAAGKTASHIRVVLRQREGTGLQNA